MADHGADMVTDLLRDFSTALWGEFRSTSLVEDIPKRRGAGLSIFVPFDFAGDRSIVLAPRVASLGSRLHQGRGARVAFGCCGFGLRNPPASRCQPHDAGNPYV